MSIKCKKLKKIIIMGFLRILSNKYIAPIIQFMFKRARKKLKIFLVLPPLHFFIIIHNK